MKKVRSSHFCTELSKTQFFPMSIVQSLEGSLLDFKKQYLLKRCSTKFRKSHRKTLLSPNKFAGWMSATSLERDFSRVVFM